MTKKRILLACAEDKQDTVVELPYLLHKAGWHVSVICPRHIRDYISSFVDRWHDAPQEGCAFIAAITHHLQSHDYDWILVGDDYLLRAVVDAVQGGTLDPATALRLSPIKQAEHLAILGSKTACAMFMHSAGIMCPPSAIAKNTEEAIACAHTLGFPVMIKQDRSSGGGGVRKCDIPEDIIKYWGHVVGPQMLVEKFIDGRILSADTFYLGGQLAGYNLSEIILSHGPTGISLRRAFLPSNPSFTPTLEKIGQKLSLQGFMNFSLVQDPHGVCHLFELDMRPNAWFVPAQRAGINLIRALNLYTKTGAVPKIEQASPDILGGDRKIVSLYHREFSYFLEKRDPAGLRYWLSNTNGCWQSLPLYDLRLFFLQSARLADYGWQWLKQAQT